MKNALAVLAAFLPCLALAQAPKEAPKAPAQASWHPLAVTLAPQKDHEVCTHMEKGETRRYNWKSDTAVDFNIHHHKGGEVMYPVKRAAMRGDGGSFTARAADEYCWMWTARGARAKIEGRLEDPPEVTVRKR
jgi:hypothetical protein